MFLVINCRTREAYQQPFEPTDAQRADPDLLMFQTDEVRLRRDEEKQVVFEVACDSLSGWDELPVAEKYPPQWEQNNGS